MSVDTGAVSDAAPEDGWAASGATGRTVRLLGISGSLRGTSASAALLHAVREVAPDDVMVELHLLDDVPPYDADIERELGHPAPVRVLLATIAGADGVLLASPEYEAAESEVLNNALEWAARGDGSPLQGKSLALLDPPGATGRHRVRARLEALVGPSGARIVEAKVPTSPHDDVQDAVRAVVLALRDGVLTRRARSG